MWHTLTHKLQSFIKLSGFGMTRDLSEEDYSTITVGERLFMKWTAPEVLFYKKYSTSSDVWSYGMLMYEIWSLGHAPFGDSQPKQVLQLLMTTVTCMRKLAFTDTWWDPFQMYAHVMYTKPTHDFCCWCRLLNC